VLKILQPILSELATLEGGIGVIDLEEFVDAVFRLDQILNVQERDFLANFDRLPAKDY
jgi:hypothetical protein